MTWARGSSTNRMDWEKPDQTTKGDGGETGEETTSGLASATFVATAGISVCARVPANVPTAALQCVLPNITP